MNTEQVFIYKMFRLLTVKNKFSRFRVFRTAYYVTFFAGEQHIIFTCLRFINVKNKFSRFGFFRGFSGFRVGSLRVRVFSGSGSGRVGLGFSTRMRTLR